MALPESLAGALGRMPGVSFACVLDRESARVTAATRPEPPPVPPAEILAAFGSAERIGGPASGGLHVVVVTGPEALQVLVPVAGGVLYLRLVRSRANLATTLREIEAVRATRAAPVELPRRPAGRVIPPPRSPPEEPSRWATDLGTLRRLADGLRRRLR